MVALFRSRRGLALRRALCAWSQHLGWSCARAWGNLAGIPAIEGPNAAGHKRVPSPSPPAEGALSVAPVGLARHPPKH